MDDPEANLADLDVAAAALSFALRRVTDMRLSSAPNEPFSAMATAFVAAFHRELVAWLDVHGLVA